MAGRAGLGNGGAGSLRLMRRMAVATGRKFAGRVFPEDTCVVKLLAMTILADLCLALDEQFALIAPVPIMAE